MHPCAAQAKRAEEKRLAEGGEGGLRRHAITAEVEAHWGGDSAQTGDTALHGRQLPPGGNCCAKATACTEGVPPPRTQDPPSACPLLPCDLSRGRAVRPCPL